MVSKLFAIEERICFVHSISVYLVILLAIFYCDVRRHRKLHAFKNRYVAGY